MEITLEDIDAVRERSGVSYQAAREALERSGGDPVQALIDLEYSYGTHQENDSNRGIPRQTRGWGNKITGEMRTLMDRGNSVRIRIGAGDNTLLELPVILGALGALFFPRTIAVGTVGLLMAHCRLELTEQSGEYREQTH